MQNKTRTDSAYYSSENGVSELSDTMHHYGADPLSSGNNTIILY